MNSNDNQNDENDVKKFFYINEKKKQWKKKENLYCCNCGKIGHTIKRCYEPVTSYGIICIRINHESNNNQDGKINDFFISKYKFPEDMELLKNICINKYIQKNINCNNRKDLDIYEDKVIDGLEYIIVRRKQTFNYIYLIRGIYNFEVEDIIKSINLITNEEYEKLITKTFDELWEDIWGENAKKVDFMCDYDKAKEKFALLRDFIIPQITHRINITYKIPEWGFPKGRRIENETNIECAKREFIEETGLKEEDFILLDRLFPLIENIKGTNGINYKHVYYIALLKDNFNTKNIKLNQNLNQQFEIGDIGIFNMEQTCNILRKYDVERKELLNNLKLFFIYNMRYFEKFYHEKTK